MGVPEKSGESVSEDVASHPEGGVSVLLDEAQTCIESGDYRQAVELLDGLEPGNSQSNLERVERVRNATSVTREGLVVLLIVGVGLFALGLALFV